MHWGTVGIRAVIRIAEQRRQLVERQIGSRDVWDPAVPAAAKNFREQAIAVDDVVGLDDELLDELAVGNGADG